MEQLSPAQQKLVDAILTGVDVRIDKKFKECSSACSFSPDERKHLHEFLDAIQDEGANRETHIIVLRIGMGVQNAVKRAATTLTWSILGLAVYVMIMFLTGRWRLPKF